jgi:hypothetical protein
MQSQSSQLRILNNASSKIKRFYHKVNPNRQYYLNVLKARNSSGTVVEPSGNINMSYLRLIEEALRKYFGMARVMAKTSPFIAGLNSILMTNTIQSSLKTLRGARILSPSLNQYVSVAQVLYNSLSASGPRSLAAKGCNFPVGATKIMHCLFPEFFIILDSHVAGALYNNGYLLRKSGYNNFDTYWKGMQTCHNELQVWCEIYGSANSLLQLDPQRPTTPVRIFDICCW